MFKFLKRKSKKDEEDPILKMLNEQTAELRSIMDERRRELEQEIKEKEEVLKQLGYSDKDLERLELNTKFKVL